MPSKSYLTEIFVRVEVDGVNLCRYVHLLLDNAYIQIMHIIRIGNPLHLYLHAPKGACTAYTDTIHSCV